MLAKSKQRLLVVKLRKDGHSYSEILQKVHVSKSSLSLWLKGIRVSHEDQVRFKTKGDVARRLGSEALRRIREAKTKVILNESREEISRIDNEALMLIGSTLYWAEGSKQNINRPSKGVVFNNSDPRMIKVYLKWLDKCLKIPFERISFEIYIHKSHKKSIEELVLYWSEITGFPRSKFGKVYFKKNKIHSIRKNRGSDYSGVLRISIKKSTDLNRKIVGWVEGICLQTGAI